MVDVNFGVDVRARIRLTPVPRLVLALCRRHSTSKLRAGWAKLSYGKLKKPRALMHFAKVPGMESWSDCKAAILASVLFFKLFCHNFSFVHILVSRSFHRYGNFVS